MNDATTTDAAKLFDGHAAEYEKSLNEGLAATGEEPAYFAERRVAWTRNRLAKLGVVPKRVLDFGCGTGGSTPFLLGLPGVESLVGGDVSDASLDVARARWTDPRVRFTRLDQLHAGDAFDLAFCNGVFHHIPPADRAACTKQIFDSLRPGGVFAMWENNPWNPGARFVMSRIPFDRDAVTLSPPETRQLLKDGGLPPVASDFLFIFPRPLAWLRRLEPLACKLPIGGQYLTLGRRPLR